MNTELEERLRADLPRLGELIEHDAAPDVVALPAKRRPRRIVAASIAAGIALAAIVAGVAVRGGHHEHIAATTPSVDVTPSTWRALPPSPLGQRGNPVVVWTGKEVLVWGGYRGDPNAPLAFQSGAAYNPATNAWRKIADNQWAHPGAIGVWGGDRMYALAKNGGAYYLPATDEWHDLPRLDNEAQSGFIGAATDGTTLYGIVYNDDPQHPAIEAFVYKPGYRGWQLRTPLAAALQSGVSRVPVIWSGDELVVSDGGAKVWDYDPADDLWHASPSLPEPATATSLTRVNGVPVAVFLNDGGLKAAILGFSGWTVTTSGDTARAINEPLALDAGGTLVVIDRAGGTAPVRADQPTGGWAQLGGYPLALGVNGNAVGTGDALFVWGGLTPGTPAPGAPDAAWYGP